MTPVSDCILQVALKNFEYELSYILAELFNMCLKKSLILSFKNVRKSVAKSYGPLVFLLWLGKSLKNL